VNDPTRFLSFYNPKTFPNENVKSYNPRQIGTNKGIIFGKFHYT